MDTPQGKMSIRDFRKAIEEYAKKHYVSSDNGKAHFCKKCGTEILKIQRQASVHSSAVNDTCIGSDDTIVFYLPYCPNCEGEPIEAEVCVHG